MPRNIVLVGCGAIAQAFYLPALAKLRSQFDRLWLVDPSDHALAGARTLVNAEIAHSLGEVDGEATFAIIATPNALHLPLAREALARGAHVLIEKPFVSAPENGRQLVAAAAAMHRVLAVNQTRRLFPVTQELRQRIGSGEFGALVAIEHFEGVKLNWPFESGAAFAKGAQRTGVIMDFGVHVLDWYQYLLRPQWSFIAATHDGFAGPEGLAEIHLKASGVPVSVRLSRYQEQDNVARLSFEKAEVTAGVFDWNTYSVGTQSAPGGRTAAQAPITTDEELAEKLLLNFVAAAEGQEPPLCDAASSLPVIEILDHIYRLAGQYPSAIGAV